MILTPSWDARCVAITESEDVNASRAVICLFTNRGQLGLRDLHDPKVLTWAKTHADSLAVVRGESEDVRTIWGGIADEVNDLVRQTQRPLRVLVDLSTCPRYYANALLGVGLGRGLIRELVFFYAEAKYPDPRNEPELIEPFTSGRWETIPVPDLYGSYDPTKRRFYLVSVGFEGAKTFTAVARADPERVALLFPRPGFLPEYEARAEKQSRQLREEFDIPDDAIVEAPAGDAVETWRAITDRALEAPELENIFYLCSGTKPHALALALRALALGSPAVLYNRPARHKETETRPSGVFWTYKVTDTTAPI